MNPQHQNESKLTAQLRAGSKAAFSELVDRYGERLFSFARKYLKKEEIAEEVVQDVFVKIWNYRERLDPGAGVEKLLFTMCRNHVLNTLKHLTRDKKNLETYLRENYHETEEQPPAEDRQIIEKALSAIQSLPPQRRLVFQLCKLEGLSYEQVSIRLSISKGTINDHIMKANRAIRKYLETSVNIIIIFFFSCAAYVTLIFIV